MLLQETKKRSNLNS